MKAVGCCRQHRTGRSTPMLAGSFWVVLSVNALHCQLPQRESHWQAGQV